MTSKSAPGGVVVVTFGSADHDECTLTRCPMAPVDWFPDRAAASAHADTLPEGFEPHILTVSTGDGAATPAGSSPAGSSPAGVDAVLARQHGAYCEALAALVGAVIDVAELYPRAGAELAGAVDHATKVLQHHAAIADNRVVAPGTPFDPAVVASIAADPAVLEALQQDADLAAAASAPDDRRPAAGVSRVAVVILVEPADQDPADPTGLTHIACNNLGSALEGAGFELAGAPGRHEIAPVPEAGDAAAARAATLARSAHLAFAEAVAALIEEHGDDLTIAGAHAPTSDVDVIAPCTMLDQPSIGVALCDGRRYLLTVEAVDGDRP